jgi:hypothetical protein
MEGRVASILIDTIVKTIQILGNGITAAYAIMVPPLLPPPKLKRCYCSGAFANGNCICYNKPMSYQTELDNFPILFPPTIEDLPRPLNNV